MKSSAIPVLAACFLACTATASFAAAPPNPADYSVAMHVTSSQTRLLCRTGLGAGCINVIDLEATLDGHAYSLTGNIKNDHLPTAHNFSSSGGYLALGDYKAKLLPSDPKDVNVPYFIIRNYEVLFPDGRVGEFQIRGESQ